MHPIEQKITKSFHFVKRDIEQLQRAYLAHEKTQTKMLDTIAEQDKVLKQHNNSVDDVKIRVSGLEKASGKHNSESKAKFKRESKELSDMKKALTETQKMLKTQAKTIEQLSKKVEKLTAKPVVKKKAVKK